jgi:hypothetical protein
MPGLILRSSPPDRVFYINWDREPKLMTASGQQRRFAPTPITSAVPPKADIRADMDLRRCGPILLQNYFEHPGAKD